MHRRNLIVIILSSIIMFVALSTFVYAWFSLVEKTQEIIIYSGRIELEAKLFELGEEEEITEISLTNVIPGDVFSYELTVENIGTIIGDLEILFTFNISNEALREFIIFEIEVPDNSFTDSTDVTDLTYLYQSELEPFEDEPMTIYFNIRISTELELEHLNEGDKIILQTIFIKLSQQV